VVITLAPPVPPARIKHVRYRRGDESAKNPVNGTRLDCAALLSLREPNGSPHARAAERPNRLGREEPRRALRECPLGVGVAHSNRQSAEDPTDERRRGDAVAGVPDSVQHVAVGVESSYEGQVPRGAVHGTAPTMGEANVGELGEPSAEVGGDLAERHRVVEVAIADATE
jgi:hypothetical protein